MNLPLLIFSIGLCAQRLRGQLLTSPMNTIATTGQRVELECSTNVKLPLSWDFAVVNSTRFEPIYHTEAIASKFSSRYNVTPVNGRFALVIDSVDKDHAGTYKCQNTQSFIPSEILMNASAQLFVIDSDPLCGINATNGDVVEGEYYQMRCSVSYSGNWILAMEWTRNDGQTVDSYIHSSRESRKVTSSLIKQLASSDNDITFTCQTSLIPNGTNNIPAQVDKIKATNIPYYRYSWNYTANVLYGPRNQTISLIYDASTTGSHLECFADGNPTPSYEWKIDGKNTPLSRGSVIVISESMIFGEEQRLRCAARNYVAGQIRSNEATFPFSLAQIEASSKSYIVVVTLSGLLAVIGLVALGLGVALTVKARAKGNAVNSEPIQEYSAQPHDYETVDEFRMKSGACGKPPLKKSTAKKECTENRLEETTECEGYSSLIRRCSPTFPKPELYAELQQYDKTGGNDYAT